MSAVIAISNRKGGTGKTATAVNLTAAAAASGRRTLLIDLDTQGHAGIGFGITSRSGEPSVHDLFRSGEIDLIDTIRPSGFERVSVAPADPMFDGSASERSPSRLARQLRRPEIAERFDLVVIDTPPAYDMLLINALAAADGVIVPTLPHALSAEGVRQFARILFKVATSLNPAIQLLGLLPVMIGANALHHRVTTEGLARDFGADRILQGIRSDIRVAEAFGQRKPLREHAPDCRAAEDYDRLFLQLAERRAFTPRQACYN